MCDVVDAGHQPGVFDNQKDVRKGPSGPVQDPKKDVVSDPQGFLGISKAFGFTKRNEVGSHNSAW